MDTKEVKRTGGKEGREMIVVRLKNENQKRIIEEKMKLKNRKEWVEKDLTWKERRTKWLLKRKAKSAEERRN